MKETNLISILSAFNSLDNSSFESYLAYHSIKIKTSELKDLQVLVDNLKSLTKDIVLFDKHFISYSIPQIGKEFDLLRIDDDTVVNIELKKKSTDEKITAQLLRNQYYLGFLKRKTFCYTFVSEENKLYSLNGKRTLEEVSLRKLLGELVSQKVNPIRDIDSFFNPSNYLVSPFNSTGEFVKGNYFLTTHQEEIKNAIFQELRLPGHSVISIKGNAGTGKTLLTYDIAKEVLNKRETLLIHCGYLNEGQIKLRDDFGWNIIPAKNLVKEDLSKYHLIVTDEAQRIFPGQLLHLIREVKRLSTNVIFSYDGQQTLRKWESNNNIADEIENELTIRPFELTNKIRTNKEVASFIGCLFNKKRVVENYRYGSIDVVYFDTLASAKDYLNQITFQDWQVINYTPSNRDTFPYEEYYIAGHENAHTVIGQEFNNVAAVIDGHFYYKTDGSLSTRNYHKKPYYHPAKMLFQIVSRTRLKLRVLIVNNKEILDRCLEILNQK